MLDLFPNGILHYLIGGILLGVAVNILYIFNGNFFGATSILHSFASLCFTRISKSLRTQRIILFVGIVLGAATYAVLSGNFFVTSLSIERLIIGGFLIGFGATLAKGCTSGHGICGLASLSKASMVYVAIFMIVAIITVRLI